MNDATLPLIETTSPLCDQCGKQFEPRAGSGGKPQRFCSPTCRTDFHAQRGHRDGPNVGESDVAPEQMRPTTDDRPSTGVNYVVDDFTWDSVDVAIEEQRRTCIYWNIRGDLVIRQVASDPHDDDDPYVVICQSNIADFVDKLCDFIGILSAGRQS